VAVAGVERLATGARRRQAGHRAHLAPTWVPPVLDLEESLPCGPSSRGSRGARVDSSNGRRESALGCATDSWGTAEAGISGGSLRITPLLRHQSGQPFGRTFVTPTNYGSIGVLAEPIGTRRMDNVTMLDVRLE
jgi:hypothetical protein